MATAISNKPMELEGNLKAFQLGDILRFLALGKMTGVLSLIGEDRTVELTIKEGLLVGVGSNERFLRLGQMLVYSGLISRRKLDEALESQRDDPNEPMLGEVLVSRQLVSPEQIERALTLQMKEELWELFSWNDGTFKFEHGTTPAMKRVMVSLEIEPLIDEAVRRMEDWRAIAGNLGDLGEVFRVRGDLAGPPEARLNANTWHVLSLINGHTSVQVISYLSGLGKFETLCALDRLLSLQIIEPVARKTRRSGGGDIRILSVPSAPAAGNPEERAEAPEEEAAAGGLRGLLKLRRKTAQHTPPPDENPKAAETAPAPARVGPYATSVGLACAMISRMVQRLCMEADFRPEGTPAALCEALWFEIGARFPRADLIQGREGQLDATTFERYAQMAGGVDGALAGCHEDSMEALAAIGRALVEKARQRLGIDRANKIIQDTTRPYLEGIEVNWPHDFITRAWTRLWLGA